MKYLILFFLLIAAPLFAAETGVKHCTTVTLTGWTTDIEACTDNDVYATDTYTSAAPTDTSIAHGFGFTTTDLPTGSIVEQFRITIGVDSTDVVIFTVVIQGDDGTISTLEAAGPRFAGFVPGTKSEGTILHLNNEGGLITSAQVRGDGANEGLSIRLQGINTAAVGTQTAKIDYTSVRVLYRLSGEREKDKNPVR